MNTAKIMILIAFCGALHLSVFAETRTNGEPNKPAYPKPISPDELKQDLDFLLKTIEEVHPNMYAYTGKEEFDPLREKLYESIDHPMNRLEFYKLAAPVVAALKNGHTMLQPPYLQEFLGYYKGGGHVFPLEIRWDGPTAIVSKNYSRNSLPLNGQILTINGRSAREMFADFSRLFAAECRHPYPGKYRNDPILLRFLLFLEYGRSESWDLRIRSEDGKVKNYTIQSVAATKIIAQEAKNKDLASKFSYHHFPNHNAVLLEIKSFGGLAQRDVFQRAFQRFLNDNFRKIGQQKVGNLIIDIRNNEGGADNFVHLLMEYLTSKPYQLYEKTEIKISAQSRASIEHIRRQVPDKFANKEEGDIVTLELSLRTPPANPIRFTGRVFVLIGSRTWSASTVFASAAKYFHVGTLVGEETPDTPTLYGSSIMLKMPNSQLQYAVASKLLVCAGGKPDGRGVLPDYEVEQKAEDAAKGVDTALQFTLNLMKGE